MARPNKRHREERRFGRPERLADRITTTPVEDWIFPDPGLSSVARCCQDLIATAHIVQASNVGEFYYISPKNRFDYMSDFPNPMPPFPTMFVEMSRPSRIVCEDEVYEWPDFYPSQYGCLVRTGIEGTPPFNMIPGIDILLEEARKAGVPHFLVLQIGFSRFRNGDIYFDFVAQCLVLDRMGVVLSHPFPMVPSRIFSEEEATKIYRQWTPLFQSVTLTQSFMNCKNVTFRAHEPDRAVNRERRKHDRPPFLRYHTIDIEPMKRVLRTEGGIETNGLKRALHIARGHFARYTEERPLFGRLAGTFWIPAHTRGTLKNGIVVSDYNVKAPSPGGEEHAR